MAEDNEEIDAYILGETEPLERYVGKVIAVIYPKNDVENKLVVSNREYTVKEIIKQVDFQEKFFEIEIKI